MPRRRWDHFAPNAIKLHRANILGLNVGRVNGISDLVLDTFISTACEQLHERFNRDVIQKHSDSLFISARRIKLTLVGAGVRKPVIHKRYWQINDTYSELTNQLSYTEREISKAEQLGANFNLGGNINSQTTTSSSYNSLSRNLHFIGSTMKHKQSERQPVVVCMYVCIDN